MRRYKNLADSEYFEALNRLRSAFLAAKNGEEVDKIIDGLLTQDEKLKIGRRILIAEHLLVKLTIDEIVFQLKVGRNTVLHVSRRLEKYRDCFDLIEKRGIRVEKTYQNKKFKRSGGSKLIIKKKSYSGFKRKDVRR